MIAVCKHVNQGSPAAVCSISSGSVTLAVCLECSLAIDSEEHSDAAVDALLESVCEDHAAALGVPRHFKSPDGLQIRRDGVWQFQPFAEVSN